MKIAVWRVWKHLHQSAYVIKRLPGLRWRSLKSKHYLKVGSFVDFSNLYGHFVLSSFIWLLLKTTFRLKYVGYQHVYETWTFDQN